MSKILDTSKYNMPAPTPHQLVHFKAYEKKLTNYLRFLLHEQEQALKANVDTESLSFGILSEEILFTENKLASVTSIYPTENTPTRT